MFNPEIKVVEFSVADIITVSGGPIENETPEEEI